MRATLATVLLALCLASVARADAPTPMKSLAKMPVKEITVFKDGHAFVLHSGKMATDPAGNVVMDYLPAPVIGTFWPYSAEKNAKLSAVVASQQKVLIDRTAIAMRELIEANIGAAVLVTEMPPDAGREAKAVNYEATIAGVPEQSGEELEATSPPNTGEKLPIKGNVVLMKTGNGMRVVNIDRIIDITFKADLKPLLPRQEFRNLLTLKLEWAAGKPAKEADVGLVYLQRGIRWIPEYKVTLDGKDSATISLQATILNEMCDLDDVSAHLVVGVPNFFFKDTIDPIALQKTVAQLSQYFRQDDQMGQLSNGMMTQAPRMTERAAPADAEHPPMDLGPEVGGAARSEDLFLFTIKHVTLRKGQRMVFPIAEYKVPYKNVYALDLPVAPPPELRGNINTAQQAEIARLLAAPKVMHKVRLTNKSDCPFTTCPALLLENGRMLAQSMMTYTAVGGETDLDVTAAVDVQVKKTEKETKRTPNAATWQNVSYARTDLEGSIKLTNYGKDAIDIKVTRFVLGAADSADNKGVVEMVNQFEDNGAMWTPPTWWNYYSWPHWWTHFNGVGKITWEIKLDPGKGIDLTYVWHYFWT